LIKTGRMAKVFMGFEVFFGGAMDSTAGVPPFVISTEEGGALCRRPFGSAQGGETPVFCLEQHCSCGQNAGVSPLRMT